MQVTQLHTHIIGMQSNAAAITLSVSNAADKPADIRTHLVPADFQKLDLVHLY